MGRFCAGNLFASMDLLAAQWGRSSPRNDPTKFHYGSTESRPWSSQRNDPTAFPAQRPYRKSYQTAVDADVLAGDPAGGVAGEKRNDFRNFRRLSQAAEHGQFGEAFQLFRRFAVQKQFRLGRAGRNGVDGDAARAEFAGEGAGELFHGAFGRDIGSVSRHRARGGGTGKIDDPSAIGQAGGGLLTREENAFDVDGKDAVELGFGGGADGFGEHDAGVVDKNVQPAEMCEGLVKQPDNFADARHVCLHGESFTTGGFDFVFQFHGVVGVARVIDGDGGAFAGEALGDGASNAARGAGDEGDFSFKIFIHARKVMQNGGSGDLILRTKRLRFFGNDFAIAPDINGSAVGARGLARD
jgi:hypothetical protein